MLYEKSQSPQLDIKLFENPTSEYRGTPFWSWNCKLSPELLIEQIRYLKEMGFGGFHMHPRTGMVTRYLSDEFMDLVKTCVNQAEQEGLLAWLYDEDRWPSGAAGGLVTKTPKYRQRLLTMTPDQQESVSREDAIEAGAPYLLACYDIVLHPDGTLKNYKQIAPDSDAAGTKWYAYVCTPPDNPWFNNQTYVDTLNPEAIQAFIDLTYGGYQKQIGEKFGSTVPAIFTDEPQFAIKQTLGFPQDQKAVNLPWSMDVPDTYRAAYHADLTEHLPELFWDLPDGQISVHRYHYHDHLAERFAASFADQCGGWCKENGLRLTGHVMNEESLQSQTCALGEAMRSYRSFQIPGIDMLCDRVELTTTKQAQSAVRQYGTEGMLSELYGVTNWDFDFRGHKFQGDWQAALGVTVRVPHLSWVSMAGEAKRDYPASINYQSPWYQQYPYVEDHFARVNTAMTRGIPQVRVGVIHPIESYWLHWGPKFSTSAIREQLEEQFQSLTQWLTLGCIDFDFISEALLPSQCKAGSAPLQVGEMSYDVILVPGCETLRRTTLERLKAFRAQGGALIFMGTPPKYTDAVPAQDGQKLASNSIQIPFDECSVLDALDCFRDVEIWEEDGRRSAEYLYQMRLDQDCRWLFLARGVKHVKKDLSCPKRLRIVIRGAYAPVLYDTIEGTTRELDYQIENGNTVIHHTLYASDSLLLQLKETSEQKRINITQTKEKVYQTDFRHMVSYRREEPNVMLLDQAEFALDDGDFEPSEEILRLDNICRARLNWPSRMNDVAQPWVMDDETITHKLTLRFTIHSQFEATGTYLAAEDAEKLDISLNGIPVSNEIAGFYVDKSIKTVALPSLKSGTNQLIMTMPFGQTTNTEWCYLLGEFNVQVSGCETLIVPPSSQIGFSSITNQGMPFYGGNLIYETEVQLPAGELVIRAGCYRGSLIRVAVDGKDCGIIAYDPYTQSAGPVTAGTHTITFTLYGNRFNTFGALHDIESAPWAGPDLWRTKDDRWCYEYRLRETGILASPIIEVYQ